MKHLIIRERMDDVSMELFNLERLVERLESPKPTAEGKAGKDRAERDTLNEFLEDTPSTLISFQEKIIDIRQRLEVLVGCSEEVK